jgi:hypothetical protein
MSAPFTVIPLIGATLPQTIHGMIAMTARADAGCDSRVLLGVG